MNKQRHCVFKYEPSAREIECPLPTLLTLNKINCHDLTDFVCCCFCYKTFDYLECYSSERVGDGGLGGGGVLHRHPLRSSTKNNIFLKERLEKKTSPWHGLAVKHNLNISKKNKTKIKVIFQETRTLKKSYKCTKHCFSWLQTTMFCTIICSKQLL